MSLAVRAVRGTAIILVSSYANMAMGIGYGIVMARLLDPAHFGIFGLGLLFFSLPDVRSKLGLDFAFIHRQPTTEALVATHWVLQMGAALITLGVTIAIAIVVSQANYPPATAPIMIALGSAMMLEAAGSTARAALEKELVFKRSTAIVTGALLISYLAAIGMALNGLAYWALVGQVAVNALVGALGFWWAYRHMNVRPVIRFVFDRALAGWMIRFGTTVALGAIASTMLLQFDNLLVGTFVGATALGFYLQAYKVAQWPTGLVTHIVSRAALPTYAQLQADTPRLSKAFGMSLWLILTVATPIALAIFASAPDFLRWLYGDKWLPSAPLLRVLVIYSVLRPVLDDTGAFFNAIGQPKRMTTVLVIQAVTLIAIATPLTLAFQAIGTAIGVGAAFVVGIVLTYRFVSRTIPLDVIRMFLPPGIAALISTAAYFAIAALADLNALPLFVRVIVKGGFTVAAFYLIVFLIERRTLAERITYIWRLLRGRPA
ncbi:MAG TPA: oligosaccharide flippase family protein [Anaerolineae bacterium]